MCQRSPGVAGGGDDKFVDSQFYRFRNRHRHPARFKAPCRVERFVLHEQIDHPIDFSHPVHFQQGRVAFSERKRKAFIADRQ